MKEEASTAYLFNRTDYLHDKMEFFNITEEQRRPRLLLHACCGPCSTACVERLAFDYSITLYYYNPNIMDSEEYFMRKDSLLKFINCFNEEYKDRTHVDYLEGAYEPSKFIAMVRGLENEPEGGARCDKCFEMRLTDTAIKAKELEFDYFTTTMSVSPHKSYPAIYTLGVELENRIGVKFLDVDFKKKNGFGRSVELSKKYGLYRQDFCGCEYARHAVANRLED